MMKISIRIITMFAFAVSLAACNEEDPFVDRTVAPVLIVFDDVPGYLAGGGLTAVPNITKNVNMTNYNEGVTLNVSFYELDKSRILDHTLGIDSIPVTDLSIVMARRDAPVSLEAVSDSKGKIALAATWEQLGINDVEEIVMAPQGKTIVIPLAWSGSYKGNSFTRYSQLTFVKNPD